MFPDRVWILASLDHGHQNIAGDGWTLHISPTLYSLQGSLDDFLIDWCSRRSNCSSRGHPWFHRRAGTICQGVENGTVEFSQEVERVDMYMAVRMIENHATCASSTTPNSSCSSTSMFDHVMTREVLPSTNESHSMNRFGGELGMNGRMSALPWGYDIRAGRIASSGNETNTSGGGSVLIGRYMENGLSSEMVLVDDDLVIWPLGKGKIPESHCSVTCPSSHSRFSLPGQPSCCFLCLYCEGNLNFTSDGSMRCEKCPQGYWFNVTLGSCEPRYLDFLRWDSIPALVYIVVCSFSILVNLIVLGVIAYHHASPIVKAANSELSLLLLVCTTVALVAPILHIGIPTVQQCMVHVGLQGPMITMIASIYLVKTKGVLSIFEAKLPDLMHSNLFLQRHLQFLAVLVLVLIEAVAVAVYLLFAPPGVSYIDSHVPHITYVECNYGLLALPVQWLYNWVIVVLAFVLAYRARHLPENFGEARLIAKSMGFSLLMWFLSFMCFLLSSGSMKALFQNAILVASPWIFMGFLYFPKCYIILRQPHRNTAQELRRMTLAHVQKRAEQVCDSSASRRFGSQDEQKQTPSETSYKEKRDGQKKSSVNRGSSVKDGRIVLQIDAPEVSRQLTDETAISGSGSVSPSSDRSSRDSFVRDPVISSLNYASAKPPDELENYIHGNGCSTPYPGNANNSNSYPSHDANDDEAHRTFADDAENPEMSLRLGVAESSASHPTSCTAEGPDQPVVSTPSETPQENDGETDICSVDTPSSHGHSDTNDIVTEDRRISKKERCGKVDIGRIER
eukprot:XP_011678302.1 PREDICTED: vomeronasal type-2 receptor 116-like [Strongylocentrotus purpuratus]